ncbi:MAG: hypothetical protein H6510_03115 [Acidobacteria bacterium]|nr:hypothetical protein [Acidobacteriota bacterium]
MNCAACAIEQRQGHRFCTACGERLSKSRHRRAWMGISLLGLLLGFWALWQWSRPILGADPIVPDPAPSRASYLSRSEWDQLEGALSNPQEIGVTLTRMEHWIGSRPFPYLERLLANLFAQQQDWARASHWYARYLKQSPQDGLTRYRYIQALMNLRDTDRLTAEITALREGFPCFGEARRFLAENAITRDLATVQGWVKQSVLCQGDERPARVFHEREPETLFGPKMLD